MSESVDFPSLLDMYLPVFLVLLLCVCVLLCHGVYRQTNRHSAEISEIVPAHTRAHTHTSDSLSLLIQSYMPTCILVCVYVHICSFFDCFPEYTLQLVAYLSVSPRYRELNLSNNQLSALPPGVLVGLSSLV